MESKQRQIVSRIAGLSLVGLCIVLVINSAHAYYSFIRAAKRTTWPESVFTRDHTGENFQGIVLTGLSTAGSIPNNDNLGLILASDARMNRSGLKNCTDGATAGNFGPPTQSEFQAAYQAMATWDSVASTTVNLAFVCLLHDIGIRSFDAVDDGTLDIFRSNTHRVNNITEIVYDDTTGAQMITALNLGIDPTVLLGLALPFDTSNNLIAASSANGIIQEGFIVINVSPTAPSSDLQAVITHEIGHMLGLGHTTAVVNRVGGTETRVPTMFFSALTSSVESRTLEADDIAGITVSYPATGQPNASFGAISGTALSTTGTLLPGASIIAQDSGTNGPEIAVVVGGHPTLARNQYLLEGIPAGTYVVRMTPMDGTTQAAGVNTASTGNVDSIFSATALSFTPEFYDHKTTATQATAVTVTVGQVNTNVNFGAAGSLGNNGFLSAMVLDDNSGCQTRHGSSAGLLLALILAGLWVANRRLRTRHDA